MYAMASQKRKNRSTVSTSFQAKNKTSVATNDASPIVNNALKFSTGKPLDADVRSYMEPRFNYDFSSVRIHDNELAAKSADSINALAYTSGNNIVFNSGEYNANTDPGKRLLAHELTHVIQQTDQVFPKYIQRMSEEDDSTEDSEIDEEEKDDEELLIQRAPKKSKAPKAPPNPCTRTILSEGSCQDLVAGSKWICCDPENGFKREGKKTSVAEPDKTCESETWTPIFTCDNNCEKALKKGCDDNDNWMAIPPKQFDLSKCGDVYTICANGKQTTGYVRDRSISKSSFEVSPGIQKALGVKVGDSFKGSVYRPGAKQETIDKDACCNTP